MNDYRQEKMTEYQVFTKAKEFLKENDYTLSAFTDAELEELLIANVSKFVSEDTIQLLRDWDKEAKRVKDETEYPELQDSYVTDNLDFAAWLSTKGYDRYDVTVGESFSSWKPYEVTFVGLNKTKADAMYPKFKLDMDEFLLALRRIKYLGKEASMNRGKYE